VFNSYPDSDVSAECLLLSGMYHKDNYSLVAALHFTSQVPKHRAGLIIGRGGETVRQIIAASGAQVEHDRDVPEGAVEKTFRIYGVLRLGCSGEYRMQLAVCHRNSTKFHSIFLNIHPLGNDERTYPLPQLLLTLLEL